MTLAAAYVLKTYPESSVTELCSAFHLFRELNTPQINKLGNIVFMRYRRAALAVKYDCETPEGIILFARFRNSATFENLADVLTGSMTSGHSITSIPEVADIKNTFEEILYAIFNSEVPSQSFRNEANWVVSTIVDYKSIYAEN